MASCVALKHIFLPEDRASSETHSEISSVHSDWSDLQTIATQLGIENVDDLYVERFKIDRQQLSNMIQGEVIQLCMISNVIHKKN